MKLLNWLNSQKYVVVLTAQVESHEVGEVLQIVEFQYRYQLFAKVRTLGKLSSAQSEYIKINEGEIWQVSADYLSLPINLKNLSKEITPGFLKKILDAKNSGSTFTYRDKKLYVSKLVQAMLDLEQGSAITLFKADDELYLAKLPAGLVELGLTLELVENELCAKADMDHIFQNNTTYEVVFGSSLEATNFGNVVGFKLQESALPNSAPTSNEMFRTVDEMFGVVVRPQGVWSSHDGDYDNEEE